MAEITPARQLPEMADRVRFTYQDLHGFMLQGIEEWGGPSTAASDIVSGIRRAYAENGSAPPTLYQILSDLEAESIPDPEWGWDGIYPQDSFVVVFGPRGVGKTFLLLGLAFAHACGVKYCGRQAKQGPVVYVLAEGRGGLGARVQAQKEYLGILGQAAGVHFITTAVPMLNDGEVTRLISTIKSLGQPPALIVWDTLSRTFVGGDENSSKDMASFVSSIDRVKNAVGGTAVVVHHSGHGTADRERGSSVLGAAADSVLALRQKDGILELQCEKQKDSVEFSPIPLQLKPVGKSCILSLHEQPWSNADFLTQVERDALRSLHAGFLADGASASAWLAASELADSSFYKARTSLVRRGLVNLRGEGRNGRYVTTSDGLKLLKLHNSTVTP